MERAPYAKCDNCPFNKRVLVPPRGSLGAEIAFVGEAPGRVEAKKGRPFVGPSGELLQRTLDRFGAPDAWVTNAALCHPPHNVIKDAALKCCLPRLVHELRKVRPKVIVALGGSALNALMGDDGRGITARRGRFVYSKMFDARVIGTFHPAAVLRRPSMFLDFASDIERVLRPHSPDLVEPIGPKAVYIIGDVDEAIEFLDELRDEVVIDLETSGFDRRRDSILCATFSHEKGTATIIDGSVLYDPRVVTALQRACDDGVKWIGHSIKFDAGFLKEQLGIKIHQWFDTMLAHYTFDERRGTHDLKQICGLYFNAPDWEGDIRKHLKKPKTDSYALLPREVLWRYAAHDGDYTWRLYEYFKRRYEKSPKLHKLFRDVLMPASNALTDIELHGVLIDEERRVGLEDEYATLLFDFEDRLVELSSVADLNPNSPQQVAHVMFDKLRLPQIRGRSTDKDVLARLKGTHPFVDTLRDYRKVAKLFSTYIVNLPDLYDDQQRVHTSFRLAGTVTGRLSSAGPNLQNIPREGFQARPELDIRSLFVASPGMVLVHADYSQAEFRVFAWLCQDPFLLNVYREGLDLHDEVSVDMYGEGFSKEQRVQAKMVNFGLLYDRSARSLARDTRLPGMTLSEAITYVNEYFARMPKAREWQRMQRKKVRTQGYIETIFGRRRRFGLTTGKNIDEVGKQAINFPPQSIANELTLISLTRLHYVLNEVACVLLTVHDSILSECRPEHVPKVARTMKETMEAVALEFLGDSVPFTTDIETGKRWGELHKYEVT